MRRAATSVLITLAVATATQAFAQQVNLTKSVHSGVPSRLGYERAWDRSCAAVAAQVSLTQQAEHGTVSITSASSTIPASTPRSGSTGPCAGRQVVGNEIVYRSEPGFHGQDHVSWSVSYGNGGGGSTSVDINVR